MFSWSFCPETFKDREKLYAQKYLSKKNGTDETIFREGIKMQT